MNRKMLSMLAGAALLSGMGDAAYADEPMRLTEAQMDEVTAGAIDPVLFQQYLVAYAAALSELPQVSDREAVLAVYAFAVQVYALSLLSPETMPQ